MFHLVRGLLSVVAAVGVASNELNFALVGNCGISASMQGAWRHLGSDSVLRLQVSRVLVGVGRFYPVIFSHPPARRVAGGGDEMLSRVGDLYERDEGALQRLRFFWFRTSALLIIERMFVYYLLAGE